MSADNGLIVRQQADGTYSVLEYNASSGREYPLDCKPTLAEAVLAADDWSLLHVVEYGISLDVEDRWLAANPICRGIPYCSCGKQAGEPHSIFSPMRERLSE